MFRFGLVAAMVCAAPLVSADPVDDVRDGKDVNFDLIGATYTYSGAMSGNGIVTDEQSPPTQTAKDPGTLNMTLNTGTFYPGVNIPVPLTGAKINATTVRWTTDTNPNQTVQVTVNGVPVTVKVVRIYGQITGACTNIDPFYDLICNQGYNVKMVDTNSNIDTWLNVNTQINGSPLLPVNFQYRDIDYVAFAGVPRGPLYAENVTVYLGQLLGGNLASLRADDSNRLSVLCDEFDSNGGVRIDGHAVTLTPGSLKILVESRASRTDLGQYTQVLNQVTNSWVQVHFVNTTLTDATYETNIPNPSQYVAGDRSISARVNWIPQGDVDAADGWGMALDRMHWNIAP